MLTVKNTKAEIISELRGLGVKFDEKLTKAQLIEIYEIALKEKNEAEEKGLTVLNMEITLNPLEKEEELKYEPLDDKLSSQYEAFLNENQIEYYSPEEDVFLIQGPKKKICVKIDDLNTRGFVYTVLNKKEFKRENARNILTLKSLKALRSYTFSNLK